MFFPRPRSTQNIPELATTEDLDALFARDLSVVFKHSPTCPISLLAHRQVSRFCADQPEVPVYLISVRRQRDMARHVSERTGVRHESPQVLVLRRGDVIGAASHDEVTAEFLASLVRG